MNPNIFSNKQDVMGFLNEIQLDNPKAISFSSGRPDESLFNLESLSEYIELFKEYVQISGLYPEGLSATLGQYNRTRGIINELVCRQLAKELSINVKPEDMLISVGAQEGIQLVINTLVDRDKESIAIENPAYIGVTGYAELMGYSVHPVTTHTNGLNLNELETLLNGKIDKKISLVCVIPDFQNPTGTQMPLETRYELLELAERHDFFILEDHAYGIFDYESKHLPTLKSLDKTGRVIYVHSYSKVIFPGLRLAAVVADGHLQNDKSKKIISGLLKMKNYTTVNTPSITQAILGGLLIQENFNLREWSVPKVSLLKKKRDVLIKSLEKHLGLQHKWTRGITWSKPKGGFFLMLELPISLDLSDVETAVKDYGVIICLKSFFEINPPLDSTQIRLAFSFVNTNQIESGVIRLTAFLKHKMKDRLS